LTQFVCQAIVKPFLKTEAAQLLGILLISGSIGYLIDHIELTLIAGLLLYILKHGFFLIKLANRITQRQQINYPYPLGIWGLVYQELDRQSSRSRKRKRILNRYTSRFRKVASAITDAYILLDKSARVEWANQAARHLLQVHWPRDEGEKSTGPGTKGRR
jgi:two-component system phosphate regulon sensor histidine kinase PhoR